jgi:hypothetical protein
MVLGTLDVILKILNLTNLIDHDKSRRWLPYIKEQAIFENVDIFKSNILDGTSNFIYKGIKK